MRQRLLFFILILIVCISGFSQGMLLPLISIILETDGVSSTINGLHATGLYIGVLLASPLMEAPLRKYGYKPLIIIGGMTVILSIISFTVWDHLLFWFILRLLIGIGDHALHFATQTWITSSSPENVRGRNISLYGLFFGIGFAAGPLMIHLYHINENLPFIITTVISLLALLTVFLLKNEYPEQDTTDTESYSFASSFERFWKILKYAWAPLLPALCYGMLEASLNSNFPVYGIRSGIDVNIIPTVVSAFAIGGIVFQIPLGILSDRFGRRNMLLFIMLFGTLTFISAGFFEDQPIALISCFFISGMLLGSTFSLSIAYMTDTISKPLLPAGNLMTGISYSIGSIVGPFLGGLVIDLMPEFSFFFFISVVLFIIFICLLMYNKEKAFA